MCAAPLFTSFFATYLIIRSTSECLSYSSRSLWSNPTHDARSLLWISKFSRPMADKVFYVSFTAKYTHLFSYAKPRSITGSVLSLIFNAYSFLRQINLTIWCAYIDLVLIMYKSGQLIDNVSPWFSALVSQTTSVTSVQPLYRKTTLALNATI